MINRGKKTTLLTVVIFAFVMLVLGSCDRPKNIPDAKLKLIFEEIYLSNAYVNSKGYSPDTMEIYKPIFEKYGYTIDDMKHTIDGFSKRKSSKFTDIIVAAKTSLNDEYKNYKEGIRIIDYIDSIAGARFKRQVYFLDSIRILKIKDTVKLKIEIPIIQGRYQIEYTYLLDTADHNRGIRAAHTMLDTITDKRAAYTNNWLNKGPRKYYSVEMEANKDENQLLLQLGNYPSKDLKRPRLSIDSLTITYFPSKAAARDSLSKDIRKDWGVPISSYKDYYAKNTQDSISLSDSLRGDNSLRDSLPRR